MQPVKGFNHLRCQFDAFGIYLETVFVYLAQSGSDIEISAGCTGKEDCPAIILDLFEAAETAPVADLFPLGFVDFSF